MAVEASLVQLRKLQGDNSPSLIALPLESTGLDAFAFFGQAGVSPNQTQGYISPPSESFKFPIKAGSASREVWLVARFLGLGFNAITGIRVFWESLNFSGLGTTGNFVSSSLGPLDVTGIHMRSEPGPIEKDIPPHDVGTLMPVSAPRLGLPPITDLSDGWLLFATGPGANVTPDQASKTLAPTVLDLTPTNTLVDPGDEILGKAILEANVEPRYSNFCVAVLSLAKDASKGTYSVGTMGLIWDES